MLPVDFADPTRTFHIAFAEGIDYSTLYAIEQMLDCRTEPCLVTPSLLRRYFEQRSDSRGQDEVLFESLPDSGEFARIIASYAVRVSAEEIRLSACGRHIWIRLMRPGRNPLDLIVREIRNLAQPIGQSGPAVVAV